MEDAEGNAQDVMVYPYFTLKCLESFSKTYNFIFPRALAYDNLKLVTDKKIEKKLKRW